MQTLGYKPVSIIEHEEMVEVVFSHSDLANAFAQIVIKLPACPDGNCLQGAELDAFILAQAPSREWFEAQEVRLAGSRVMQTLPAAFRAVAPLAPPTRAAEWFEEIMVGEPVMEGGRWVRPVNIIDLRTPQNLRVLKTRMLDELARIRYEHETGGITVNGVRLKTDRESRMALAEARTSAAIDPDTTTRWKAVTGFDGWDAAAIMQAGAAVFRHVQDCFTREHVLEEQINLAGTVATLMAIDLQSGWNT